MLKVGTALTVAYRQAIYALDACYWSQPRATAAVDRLLSDLSGRLMPRLVLEQYFVAPVLDRAEHLRGRISNQRKALIYAQIQQALAPYFACCGASS